jgi:hypothetical protein
MRIYGANFLITFAEMKGKKNKAAKRIFKKAVE